MSIALHLAVISATVLGIVAAIPDGSVSRIIERDVVVLGGGASGAHAAVRLREDFNKSIVIVEKQGNLGGHVETYDDPVSGKPYDYGVNSYTEYGGVTDFFARFNLTLVTPVRLSLNTTYADFDTGEVVNGYQPPASTDVTAAYQKYLEICEEYEDMLIPSYVNFPATDIPEDLLLPFRTFVEKYGLQAMVFRAFQVTGLGLADMMDELTIFVMQNINAPLVRSLLGQIGSWVPSTHRNQDLYDRIASLLGDDVLYSSTVVSANRTDDDGVTVLVQTAAAGDDEGACEHTLIRTKRLLVAFPPSEANTAPLHPSAAEQAVFAAWQNTSAVFAGIATHPALPINGSVVNLPAAAATDDSNSSWVELPTMPYVTRFEYLGGVNFRVLATGAGDWDGTIAPAEELAQAVFERLVAAGTIDEGSDAQAEPVSFPAFASHFDLHPRISVEELQNSFYQRLYALQGLQSTFWTGGAWSAHYTTILWEYNNQYLLPRLLASLEE